MEQFFDTNCNLVVAIINIGTCIGIFYALLVFSIRFEPVEKFFKSVGLDPGCEKTKGLLAFVLFVCVVFATSCLMSAIDNTSEQKDSLSATDMLRVCLHRKRLVDFFLT